MHNSTTSPPSSAMASPATRKMDHNDGVENSGGSEKLGGRGPTQMGWLKEVRASGRKVNLMLNSQGKPNRASAAWFTSYLGVCARNHVPITVRL